MKIKPFLFTLLILSIFATGCDDDEGGQTIPPVMGTIQAHLGGEAEPNQVFIDLSEARNETIDRTSWDLGFSNNGDFRVILNSTNGMLAAATSKTDFAGVSSADTAMFLGEVLNVDAIFGILIGGGGVFPPWFSSTVEWADAPNGNLNNTAIDEISANTTENFVYIINRGKNPNGEPRGFMKIKIDRDGAGYRLTYGDLDDASGQTLEIGQVTDFNFTYVHLNDGIVSVEPQKGAWDLAFSTYTDNVLSGFPAPTGFPVPYFVRDFISTNRHQVSVAMVTDASDILSAYNAFSIDDVVGLTYSSDVNSIGTNWRLVGQTEQRLYDDRFFVLQDASGKYFKILFTQLKNDQGLRGFPEFIFEELR